MNDGRFKPGQSGNPAGRPVGTKNRKTVLREELEKDGSALAAAIKAKALEGDMQAAALWLARLEPVLRPRGETVQFTLDTAAPIAQQIEQVTQAVANGDLTIEQGTQIVEMLDRLANVRRQETGDTNAGRLVDAFRQFAQSPTVRN